MACSTINQMECIICKNGVTKEGTDTLTFELQGHLIIIRDVPETSVRTAATSTLVPRLPLRYRKKQRKRF